LHSFIFIFILGSFMSNHYTRVAIVLHWLIGLSIIGLLILGLTMEDFPADYRKTAYMIHKSLGLSVLVLSLFRLIWRLTHPVPALPSDMKVWEKFAAHAVHAGLYFLMIALPLTGWALVSSSPRGFPTIWFGLFEWPPLPVLSEIVNKKEVSHSFANIHEILAWIAISLILLHLGAALKHHFITRDGILVRMLPFLKPLSLTKKDM